MLVTHGRPVYFPGINDWRRLYSEFNFTAERYKKISDDYFDCIIGDVEKMPLDDQFKTLFECCNSVDEYNLMLLIGGMNTQYWKDDNKKTPRKFLGLKFLSVSTSKKLICFPKVDNWDALILEFKFRPEMLQKIYKTYNDRIGEKDFRQMSLKRQIEILYTCSDAHIPIVLVNIGMDTINWIIANETVNK